MNSATRLKNTLELLEKHRVESKIVEAAAATYHKMIAGQNLSAKECLFVEIIETELAID